MASCLSELNLFLHNHFWILMTLIRLCPKQSTREGTQPTYSFAHPADVVGDNDETAIPICSLGAFKSSAHEQ